jgi:CBS-domain-containing membrane protein
MEKPSDENHKGLKMKNLIVRDFMFGKTLTFTADMPLQKAVDKLIGTHEHGGAVVDKRGNMIGWLSGKDCLAKMMEASYYCELAALVEDVMVTEVTSVSTTTSIIDLAQIIIKSSHQLFPVIDEDSAFVGMIARKNVLKALSQQASGC